MNNIVWNPISKESKLISGVRYLVVCFNPQNHYDIHVSIATYMHKHKPTGRHVWSGHKHVLFWANVPEMPPESELDIMRRKL